MTFIIYMALGFCLALIGFLREARHVGKLISAALTAVVVAVMGVCLMYIDLSTPNTTLKIIGAGLCTGLLVGFIFFGMIYLFTKASEEDEDEQDWPQPDSGPTPTPVKS